MTLSSRILPRDEWGKLDACPEAATIWRHLVDSQAEMVVAENEAGEIVGHFVLVPVLHAHGLWVDERYRHVGVFRALFAAVSTRVRELGRDSVWTCADTDVVRALWARLGATVVAGDHYMLPAQQGD